MADINAICKQLSRVLAKEFPTQVTDESQAKTDILEKCAKEISPEEAADKAKWLPEYNRLLGEFKATLKGSTGLASLIPELPLVAPRPAPTAKELCDEFLGEKNQLARYAAAVRGEDLDGKKVPKGQETEFVKTQCEAFVSGLLKDLKGNVAEVRQELTEPNFSIHLRGVLSAEPKGKEPIIGAEANIGMMYVGDGKKDGEDNTTGFVGDFAGGATIPLVGGRENPLQISKSEAVKLDMKLGLLALVPFSDDFGGETVMQARTDVAPTGDPVFQLLDTGLNLDINLGCSETGKMADTGCKLSVFGGLAVKRRMGVTVDSTALETTLGMGDASYATLSNLPTTGSSRVAGGKISGDFKVSVGEGQIFKINPKLFLTAGGSNLKFNSDFLESGGLFVGGELRMDYVYDKVLHLSLSPFGGSIVYDAENISPKLAAAQSTQKDIYGVGFGAGVALGAGFELMLNYAFLSGRSVASEYDAATQVIPTNDMHTHLVQAGFGWGNDDYKVTTMGSMMTAQKSVSQSCADNGDPNCSVDRKEGNITTDTWVWDVAAQMYFVKLNLGLYGNNTGEGSPFSALSADRLGLYTILGFSGSY